MKKLKKSLSLLLVLTIVLSCLPVLDTTVFAEESEPVAEGSELDYSTDGEEDTSNYIDDDEFAENDNIPYPGWSIDDEESDIELAQQIEKNGGYTDFEMESGLVNPEANEVEPTPRAVTKLGYYQLKDKFPAKKFWNGGNANKTTSSVCSVGRTQHNSPDKNWGCWAKGTTCTNGCCTTFNGAIQCMGFAFKLGYDATGKYVTNWKAKYNLNTLKPGDVVSYESPYHTIYITGVNGDKVQYADCNTKTNCIIGWNRETTKASIRAKGIIQVRIAPEPLNTKKPNSVDLSKYYQKSESNLKRVVLLKNLTKYKDKNMTQSAATIHANTYVTVNDIITNSNGEPVIKTSDNFYISAKKTDVSKFFKTNPETIITLSETKVYGSLDYTDKAAVRTITENTQVKVQGLATSKKGVPIFKIGTNEYITSNVGYVSMYYTRNPIKVKITKDVGEFKNLTNSETTGKIYKAGTTVKIVRIEYMSTGWPRLKLENGYYLTANLNYSQPSIKDIYYTPDEAYFKSFTTLISDDIATSAEFASTDTRRKIGQGITVHDFQGIVYAKNGYPRTKFKINGETWYGSAYKGKISKFYTSNPGAVITLGPTYVYDSLEYTDKPAVRKITENTRIAVQGMSTSTKGVPLLKIGTNEYITANVGYVSKYYSRKPIKIKLTQNTEEFKYRDSNETTGTVYKAGTELTITGITYMPTGWPRLTLENGKYLTANMNYSQPSIKDIYYTPDEPYFKSFTTLIEDDIATSAEFSSTDTRRKIGKGVTVHDFQGIVYAKNGYPRTKFKINGQTWYGTAYKGKISKFYTTSPGAIVTLDSTDVYNTLDYTSKPAVRTIAANTRVVVQGMATSTKGVPLLKIGTNEYITANTGYVSMYYANNPMKVKITKEAGEFKNLTNSETTGKTYKVGTEVKVVKIEYMTSGWPRLKLENGYYLTANLNYSEPIS